MEAVRRSWVAEVVIHPKKPAVCQDFPHKHGGNGMIRPTS